ncbi:hypothetical protein [Sphingorhabdus sp.]|uniref:hypothetical protein n=1 Tax=Sphingorhabdus sp. TaxID=1902408 RepID=UPI0037CAA47C
MAHAAHFFDGRSVFLTILGICYPYLCGAVKNMLLFLPIIYYFLPHIYYFLQICDKSIAAHHFLVNIAMGLTAARGVLGAILNLIPNKNPDEPGWNEQQESEYEIGKSSAEGGHAVDNQHRFAKLGFSRLCTGYCTTSQRRS